MGFNILSRNMLVRRAALRTWRCEDLIVHPESGVAVYVFAEFAFEPSDNSVKVTSLAWPHTRPEPSVLLEVQAAAARGHRDDSGVCFPDHERKGVFCIKGSSRQMNEAMVLLQRLCSHEGE